MPDTYPCQGGGRVREAVLFSRITDLRGDRIVSLPFCGYAEPLVEDSRSWEDLIPPIVAVGVPIRLRCLRVSLPRWRGRGRKVGHAALAICS